MRRVLALILAMLLVAPVFAIHSQTAEALGDVWVANYYKDSFGDNTDTCYITNRKVFKGTYKDDSINNGKLEAAIVVDAESLSFMLTLGKKGTLKNLGPDPVGYTVSVKDTNGQVYSFTGVMMGEDDRIFINAESKKTVINILSGKGVVGIYIEQDKIHNYSFKAECGNFFELYDQVFLEPIRALGYEVATYALEHKEYDAAISIFEEYIDYRDCRQKLAEAREAKNADAYSQAESLLSQGKYDEAAEAFRALGDYRDSSLRVDEVYEEKNADAYARAKSLLDQKKYDEAAEAFRALGDYKDSQFQVEVVSATQKADMYYAAEVLQAQGKYDEAIEAFESLGDFGDCKQRIEDTREMQKTEKYSEAESLLANGEYDKAIIAFQSLGDYRDSEKQIEVAREAKKALAYEKAEDLLAQGKYDEAIKAFTLLGNYKDSDIRIAEVEQARLESIYQAALSSYEAEDYNNAFSLYSSIPEYKNVSELLSSDKHLIEIYKDAFRQVGNIVTFGTYEQNGKDEDGKEDIEWIVLDEQNNKVLLISKYGLDYQRWHDDKNVRNWKTCTLRKWLNDDFIMEAYNDKEMKSIVESKMVNDGKYHHNDINDNGLTIRTEENTVDKVFLLSFMEAAQYGDEVYLFRCPVTKCAEDKYYQICSARGPHDVWNSDGWWLRSPGYSFDTAAAVRIDGELYEHGFDTYWYGFVRPAIWIDLNKLVF